MGGPSLQWTTAPSLGRPCHRRARLGPPVPSVFRRTRRWVEVTKPIPQGNGETLADELVDDGGDATLGMHGYREGGRFR